MFTTADVVLHLKTGGLYTIIGTPERVILEKDLSPCYTYSRVTPIDKVIWIRPKNEMEDGRFIKVPIDKIKALLESCKTVTEADEIITGYTSLATTGAKINFLYNLFPTLPPSEVKETPQDAYCTIINALRYL